MDAVLWLLWIVVAILTLAGELLTLALFFGSLSLAALVTAAASLLLPLPGQLAVFSVVSLLMLLAVRPVALRFLPRGPGPDDAPTLGPVGRHALATERITHLQGQIRVGSGEFWSARAGVPDAPIELGGEVEVIGMEGLTAVVRPARASNSATPESPGADPFGLSAREIEVLELLALGLSNAEIAGRLVVSQRTVDHHVSHILDKTGASGRLEAVRLGLEHGLVHLKNEPHL
jgi:membrane protein implicated in regulation of membrane protease activity/DNA-binding CsgD family transcriptional regulator